MPEISSAKRLGRLLRVTFVTMILALALPAAASAITIQVDLDDTTIDPADTAGVDCGIGGTNACNTIQRGVDEALDFTGDPGGDTVQVAPGNELNLAYAETVTVTENGLRIVGPQPGTGASRSNSPTLTAVETEAVVDPPGSGTSAFVINANDVELDGFLVEGATNAPAIDIPGDGATITDNIIRNNTIGAYPKGSDETFQRNAFYTNNVVGSANGNAIYTDVTGVDTLDVSNNAFSGNLNAAMSLLAPTTTTYDSASIADNTSVSDGAFLNVNGLEDSTVEGNNVTNSTGSGMFVGGSLRLTIQRNVIDGSAFSGIRFAGTNDTGYDQNDDVTVQGNDITNNGDAGVKIVDESFVNNEVVPIHVNRIVGNSDVTDNPTDGGGIKNTENGAEIDIDATNNWFGCNEGPQIPGNDCDDADGADVDVEPYLVFDVTASPTSVDVPGSSTITASYRTNSDGATVADVATLFPSIPVQFDEVGVGAFEPFATSTETSNTSGGLTTQTLSSAVVGSNTVTGTSDPDVSPDAGQVRETDAATVTFTQPAAPVDTDGDGVPNASDACPTQVGPAPSGCPVVTQQPPPPPPPSGGPINGTPGNDVLVGTAGNDVINCGAGDDVVNGGGGDDVINCGDGNDTVDGGAGNDTINGQNGNDTLVGGAGKDKVSGGAGKDKATGGAGKDTLSGGAGNDTLSGGAGADKLSGGTGKDKASGGSGKDKLSGGAGDDKLSGGAGNDRLSGNAGDDRLSGNAGDDILKGGAGLDVLIGGSGTNTETQ